MSVNSVNNHWFKKKKSLAWTKTLSGLSAYFCGYPSSLTEGACKCDNTCTLYYMFQKPQSCCVLKPSNGRQYTALNVGQSFRGSLEGGTQVGNHKCGDKKTFKYCSQAKGVLPHSGNILRMLHNAQQQIWHCRHVF